MTLRDRMLSAWRAFFYLAVTIGAVWAEARHVDDVARFGGAWLVLGFVFAFVVVVTALVGAVRVGVEIALQLGRIPPAWLEPEPESPVEDIEPDDHLIERVREREQLRRGF